MAALVTALTQAFIPGASPPEVRTPIVEMFMIQFASFDPRIYAKIGNRETVADFFLAKKFSGLRCGAASFLLEFAGSVLECPLKVLYLPKFRLWWKYPYGDSENVS